jgi:hypothetical protein
MFSENALTYVHIRSLSSVVQIKLDQCKPEQTMPFGPDQPSPSSPLPISYLPCHYLILPPSPYNSLTQSLPPLPKPHQTPLRARRQTILMPHHLIPLQILQLAKPLHQPHNHIPGLRQRKLLPQTNPRPPIERQKLPAHFLPFPAFRAILVCVGTPDLRAPVHHVH